MENGAISDSQISASSQWGSSLSPKNGRLHHEQGPEKGGAWTARTNDDKQWLQIDLRDQQTKVTRVGTQGRNGVNQWVTKYKLQYGNDEGSLQYFKEEGQSADKEFNGNTDKDTVVVNVLNPPITARYIRFRPVAWNSYISMRAELYDCKACINALGMENGAISDSQISASSQWNSNLSPKNGRLHHEQGPEKGGAWSARTNDDKQWLQIDLRDQQTKVTRVGTQGRNGVNQWVTKYKLQYGNDEGSLQYFKEEGQSADKEFNGNTDKDTVVVNVLNPPVTARYIRFRPVAWNSYISMRAELYDCNRDSCRSLKFTPSIDGRALVGHVIKNITLHVGMRHSCRGKCVIDNSCASFNIGPSINDQVLCQLSDSDHVRHPEDLKPRDGFTYTGTESPCSSDPCMFNGTCLRGFTYKKYLCVCQDGYWGENCERDHP
nr:venom prothrombin activator pseutarin-C non-catalytic subunit-like [Pocillopora verrucosa]